VVVRGNVDEKPALAPIRDCIPKGFRGGETGVSIGPPNLFVMPEFDLTEVTTHFSEQILVIAPFDGNVGD